MSLPVAPPIEASGTSALSEIPEHANPAALPLVHATALTGGGRGGAALSPSLQATQNVAKLAKQRILMNVFIVPVIVLRQHAIL